MRFLSLHEILDLHEQLIAQTGGSRGIRDLGALQSAINQPLATFEGTDLYPDLISKAAALCFSLVLNHPFIDGNKRIGHAAMEVFLVLNGFEIHSSIVEQERVVLTLAAGEMPRDEFTAWLREHVVSLRSE